MGSATFDTSKWIVRPDIDSRAEGAGVGYGIGSLDSGAYAGREAFAFTQAERGNGSTRIFTVFNTTAYPRKERTELTVWDYPADDDRIGVTDAEDAPIPFEILRREKGYWGHEALKLAVWPEVAPLGYTTVVIRAGEAAERPLIPDGLRIDPYSDDDLVLENENLKAVFARETMALIALTDKKSGKRLIDAPSCLFRDILESELNGMTAWRVGPYEKVRVLNRCVPAKMETPDAHGFTYSLAWDEGRMTVQVTLEPGAFALRFNVSVDWYAHGEKGVGVPQLNFAVPFAGETETYRRDIPYGILEQPALRHDVPALSMIAAGDLFLAADTKYGFRGADNTLSVTLLRASYHPDPFPEMGRHHMNLYVGVLPDGGMEEAAELLKHPLHAVSTLPHTGTLPMAGSLAAVSGPARLYAVKNAEEDGLILRLMGEEDGEVQIGFAKPVQACAVTDSTELTDAPLAADGNSVTVPVRAGKLLTLRVILKVHLTYRRIITWTEFVWASSAAAAWAGPIWPACRRSRTLRTSRRPATSIRTTSPTPSRC